MFTDLKLGEPLLRALAAEGYTHPTPVQRQAIPPVLEGRDVLACAQTGTGKTAAFALPLLERLLSGRPERDQRGRKVRVLVLAPTRELACQIADSFRAYGRHTHLQATVIHGGVSQRPQEQALRRGVDILVATPGRLLDLMSQKLVDLRHVEACVLDEADRMLDMGFIHDLRRIVAMVPRERQTLLFSATMPASIRGLAETWLRDPVEVQVTPVSSTAERIEQSVIFVDRAQKLAFLNCWLNSAGCTRALVFTRTKHGADKVVRSLTKAGIRADAIHGNKSQSARQRALERFKSSRPPVLVATDIAARGLDIDNVSHVVNFDLPADPESYVHRVGRTGRAGATGIAVSFCDQAERGTLKQIQRLTQQKLTVHGNGPQPDTTCQPSAASESQHRQTAKPVRNRQRGYPAHHGQSGAVTNRKRPRRRFAKK
jgi:ATP-dependent RNA helicase RhlE